MDDGHLLDTLKSRAGNALMQDDAGDRRIALANETSEDFSGTKSFMEK